jgi:hypothetical protein
MQSVILAEEIRCCHFRFKVADRYRDRYHRGLFFVVNPIALRLGKGALAMRRTSPAKVKPRKDKIYRFSSDFVYFGRATTFAKD